MENFARKRMQIREQRYETMNYELEEFHMNTYLEMVEEDVYLDVREPSPIKLLIFKPAKVRL